MGWEVLLFVPNVIGYIRIVLAGAAILLFDSPVHCITLYGTSILLDFVDGYAARKLNQVTAFGAWFDVVIDNFSRGLLWCSLYKWGYLVMFIEWVTFMSTHSRGTNWKIPEEDFPVIVKLVMKNSFKSLLGCFAVGSLHLLPLWLYIYQMNVFGFELNLPLWVDHTGLVIFSTGRIICLSVELFYVYNYIKFLVNEHSNRSSDSSHSGK